MTLKFICPKCGGERLIQVSTGWTSFERIELESDGSYSYCEETEVNGGELDRFECADCEFVIVKASGQPLKTVEEIVAWLKERQPETKENRIAHLIEIATARQLDLDDHVHELKAGEAAGINNSGYEEQIAFMVAQGGLDWVEQVVTGQWDSDMMTWLWVAIDSEPVLYVVGNVACLPSDVLLVWGPHETPIQKFEDMSPLTAAARYLNQRPPLKASVKRVIVNTATDYQEAIYDLAEDSFFYGGPDLLEQQLPLSEADHA